MTTPSLYSVVLPHTYVTIDEPSRGRNKTNHSSNYTGTRHDTRQTRDRAVQSTECREEKSLEIKKKKKKKKNLQLKMKRMNGIENELMDEE